jgi:large subunit ribosomal protein L17
MIHRRKGRKLKRTASHRKSLLSNLTVALIKNKKIHTTLAKAKELRVFVEPIINKSKKAHLNKGSKPEYGIHLRREVNRFLNDKGAVKMLFDEIGPKVSERSGGYTRVLKMGRRFGDGAELALIEIVDYNIEQAKTEAAGKSTSEEKKKSKTTKAKTTKSKKESETVKKKSTTRGKKKKEAAEE